MLKEEFETYSDFLNNFLKEFMEILPVIRNKFYKKYNDNFVISDINFERNCFEVEFIYFGKYGDESCFFDIPFDVVTEEGLKNFLDSKK